MKEIYTHHEIVELENYNLQKGMNYKPKGKNYSILLMSVQKNSPYNDGFDIEKDILLYEGEDVTRRESAFPKTVNQPMFTKNGKLTNNGHFLKAVEAFKLKRQSHPDKVRIYEKLNPNIWVDKGFFYLIDFKYVYSESEKRNVFKFHLSPQPLITKSEKEVEDFEFSRRIPTMIKKEVWERDGGQCVECQATQNLHFDHIIPWSKGGSSIDVKNVQVLCGKHNLQKSAKIM